MRCIPPSITQDEFTSNKEHIETREKSKEEVLEGDPKCTNIIEASMYDIKPVQYISMVSGELKWFVKEKY